MALKDELKTNLHVYLAELIGTFALVFFGTVSVTVFKDAGAIAPLPIAFAHGLTLMAMMYAIGKISGCHINPAVTISMLALKKIATKTAVFYIMFQLLGAVLAGLMHSQILTGASAISFGLPQPSGMIGNSETFAIIVEGILTFFLVFVILRSNGENAGLAIGVTLVAITVIGWSLTGAAANPARAFGPAIASNNFKSQWVYWIGPIIGGIAAAFVNKFLFSKEDPLLLTTSLKI